MLTGEKREALVKRAAFSPKKTATVYIHADFATSPVLFLDSMKMM